MLPVVSASRPGGLLRSLAYLRSVIRSDLLAAAVAFVATISPDAAATPRLALTRHPSGLHLAWPGTETRPDGTVERPWYELQYSTDLVAWSPVGQRRRSSHGEELEFALPAAAPRGFYRVISARPAALAAPVESGAEVFGYGAAFDEALADLGPISPEAFAKLFPSGAEYLPRISWDPTTARFWNRFDADPAVVNQGLGYDSPGYRSVDYRLDSREREIFLRHGFVVSERLGYAGIEFPWDGSAMGNVFYQLWYNDMPVFVSTDAALHAWHRTYDLMLQEVEETLLATQVGQLLVAMHGQALATSTHVGGDLLPDCVRDADYLVAVARSLLEGYQVPTALKQDARVAATLAEVRAGTLKTVEDFMGHCRTVDYSQFTPRGHYDRSPRLARYFQCMMWLGRIDLPVAGGPFERCPGDRRSASLRELGTALVLSQWIEDAGVGDLWTSVERTLATFVGWNDSLTFPQLRGLLAGAGVGSLADLPDRARLESLQQAILAGDLGIQNIRSDAFFEPLSDGIPTRLPRSFLVFGQRFVPDSWVFSQTVFDSIEWTENGVVHDVQRRVPSALDIAFAVLGNNQVVSTLVERITRPASLAPATHADRFRDGLPYQHNLAAARAVIDAQHPRAWESSIAMGWLATLRELSPPTTDPAYPETMRTRAWSGRTLNTQLASWTQYRHDTILYAKQSYTSVPACFYPAGFVEPRPEFWSRLAGLARRTGDVLRSLEVPDLPASGPYVGSVSLPMVRSNQVAHLERFAETIDQLATMARKELSQTPFSDAEELLIRNTMQNVGWDPFGSGRTPRYGGWYPGLFYRPLRYTDLGIIDDPNFSAYANRETYFHETYGCNAPDLLVADVHTDLPAPVVADPGSVLHQAVGGVGLLVVAIDNGNDRMVYAGPVLTHYEIEVLGDPVRLTDTAWEQWHMRRTLPPPYLPTLVIEGAAPPPWTRDYFVPLRN